MIKAVIFDLDDTLISERHFIESGYKHIAEVLEERLHSSKNEIFQMLIMLFKEDANNVFNRLFDKFKITYTQDDVVKLVNEYRNHQPQIDFFDDVRPCLHSLKKMNIKLGIITDGYKNSQRNKLKCIRAVDYFEEVIVTDELGREYWKPHPKSFEIMKEKLGVEFNEMIYIGDNPGKDFYISVTYPIKTVRINRNGIYKEMDYKNNIMEDYTIENLIQLLVLV